MQNQFLCKIDFYGKPIFTQNQFLCKTNFHINLLKNLCLKEKKNANYLTALIHRHLLHGKWTNWTVPLLLVLNYLLSHLIRSHTSRNESRRSRCWNYVWRSARSPIQKSQWGTTQVRSRRCRGRAEPGRAHRRNHRNRRRMRAGYGRTGEIQTWRRFHLIASLIYAPQLR